MNNKQWINYWKYNLADSLRAAIDMDKQDHFEVEGLDVFMPRIDDLGLVNGLIDKEEKRRNAQRHVYSPESEKWMPLEEVEVLVAPLRLAPLPEHGAFTGVRTPVFPFWYYVTLDREGALRVPSVTFPVIPRKYLAPYADDRVEFTFSTVEEVDEAMAREPLRFDSWTAYVEYLVGLFETLSGSSLAQFEVEGFATVRDGVVLMPDEETGAAVGVIGLYEKLSKEEKLPPLLHTFTTLEHPEPGLPLDTRGLLEANRLHLGQMGYDFPLSVSQRKSLYTYLADNSRVFAVNGPPGTGKTTLLQSMVANAVVQSVLDGEGETPALILACSANNQAVTNIIESFTRSKTHPGPLEGRWIPDMEGYATYLPSAGKKEAELAGINYKKPGGEGLFRELETEEYIREAKLVFEEKAAAYLRRPGLSVREYTKKLRKEIQVVAKILEDGSQYRKECLEATGLLKAAGLPVPETWEEAVSLLDAGRFRREVDCLKEAEQTVIGYFRREPVFRKLFCLLGIGTALENRKGELAVLLRDFPLEGVVFTDFTQPGMLQQLQERIALWQTVIRRIELWEKWKATYHIKGDPPASEEEYWDREYEKIAVAKETGGKAPMNCFYDELDVTLRHRAFQLAVHYWEGKWILETEAALQEDSFGSKGVEPSKKRWQRQAMLTPCFVSTFYMTPRFFTSYKYMGKDDRDKSIFDTQPLYDFIDLLIVDEAGQVTPEVGAATFALAKRAVVVGDVKQIEPVWSTTAKVDIGNLKKAGLIAGYDDRVYESVYSPKGFLSSDGSVMKMAQNACIYREAGLPEAGVLLVEHRRCYDEIIGYCNELAYHGQLKPLKGKAKAGNLFLPMCLVHVPGHSEVKNKERSNLAEAKAVAQWLDMNRKKIGQRYVDGKEYKQVEDIVGIITPFVGQKKLLRRCLLEKGFDCTRLKMGTVHALQGAERPVILFSMVYGKGDTATMFFDRDNKPNMLNVAVSRAKDSFIVFANRGIFEEKGKTPSGLLGRWLKEIE